MAALPQTGIPEAILSLPAQNMVLDWMLELFSPFSNLAHLIPGLHHLCHYPAMVLSTLLAQEAGSWALVCPNDGNFPPWAWNSGVQAVLLHRAGPPVTTGPAVKLIWVRRGESGASRASELGVHAREELSTGRARGRLQGLQGHSSLRNPYMRNIRGQAGGPESSAICQW